MSAILSFFRPAPVARGDWSQQEIAEFYRVEAALTQAGLSITTDRGLSDEGDPWFVFCRFDGDVILHFARIDDLYIVASEAFERPLRGPDFRALLNAVAADHPTLVPIPRQNQGQSSKLVLHPAALLAAIVATAAFQLAGGDAMAGELASDGPVVPMHQPGTDGVAFDTNSVMPSLDPQAHSARDELGRLTGEDEGRHARHALVLSAIALISTSLPTGQAVDATGHMLWENSAGSTRGQAVSVTVIDVSQAAVESRRLQSKDEAVLDANAGHPADGSNAPVQMGAASANTVSASAVFGQIDLVRLNVLGLGGAGGQEIAVIRAAESAPPVTAILAARMAAHAVPVAVEKTLTPAALASPAGSGPTTSGGGAPTPSTGSSMPNTTAAVSTATAAPTTAAAITASLTAGAAETGSAHLTGVSTTSTISQLSLQSQAASAPAIASAPEKTSAPSMVTSVTQSVTPATNLTVLTALNGFIDQYSSIVASNIISTIKLSELSLTSLVKMIGTGAVSDFLSSFTTYGGSVTASKLVTVPASDLAIDSLKNATKIDSALGNTMLGTSLQSSDAMNSAASKIEMLKDKAASSSESTAKVTDKVVEAATKLVGAEVTKTPLGESTTGTGVKDAASSSEGATKVTDKVVEAATKLAGAEVTKTPLGESTTGTGVKDAAPSSEGATKITDKVVEAATKLAGAEVTKTPLGESTTGTGVKDAAPSSEGATKITDKVVEAATKLAGAEVTKTPLGESTTGTGVKDAVPSSEGATKITDKVIEGAAKLAGSTTLDTSTLLHSAPVIAPQFLDEQGRQLITRFLEMTPQVQTFVSERSFVMIDMDASHYGNPDFSVRTWSIGHDVEISIVGITIEIPTVI